MHIKTFLKLSTAVALGMTATVSAAAQETGAASASESDGALAEIIVTAQRRSENLQKAAIAITAVPTETLARAGVTDATHLTAVAPSLQISAVAGSQTQFYLRGVGNFTTNSLSDSAVSVSIDGVSIARSGAVQGLFYDLERIEVLKGPQGTLYGRNATGGAINIISAKPKPGELSGYATAEYGNFDAIKLNAALNLPAGDNGAFRIAGMLSDHDGYLSDGSDDEETRAIRVQAKSELTEGFTITVGGDYAHAGGKGAGTTIVGMDYDDRIGNRDPRAAPFFTSTLAFPAFDTLRPVTATPYQDNSYFGAYAQADIDTPIGTLTLLPAYRSADINYLSCTAQCLIDDLDNQQFSFEARLASDTTSRFNYLVGVYYLDEKNKERANYNQQYNAFYVNFDSKTKSYAGFVRLGYKVTDEFRLTAGGRYTIDKKSAGIDSYNAITVCGSLVPPPAGPLGAGPCFGNIPMPLQLNPPDFVLAGLAPGGGVPIPGGALVIPFGTAGAILNVGHTVLNPSETFKKFTYRLGFEYDVAPESLLYGSFETGFKSGGFFSSIDNAVYQPETIDAWTIGSKNRFFGNRLQLNLEAFWWNYKDQQVSHFKNNTQGGVEFATENVGKTRLRGVEVEAVARVANGTTVNATVQYLDAKNQDFTFESPASQGPPITGCSFSGPALGVYTTDCSGRRPINAPEWLLSGGIEQVFDLGGGRIVFNANGRYQSAIFAGFEQLPGQKQKGYFIGDLQLKYEMDEPNIFIAGFVNNVTDKNVAAFINPAPSTGGALLMTGLRPPRTYGVRVGYYF